MKKLFPLGMLAILSSALLLHGAVFASDNKLNTKPTVSVVGKTATTTKTADIHFSKKSAVVLDSGKKSGIVLDHGKKSHVVIDAGKKSGVILDAGKKSGVILDAAKKGNIVVDAGKKSSLPLSLIGKGGKSLVSHDLFCKPYCKPFCPPWWGGGWGNSHPCRPWWYCGTWCNPGCGWFGGWCPTIIIEPIVIIETPIVGPVQGTDQGQGPVQGPGQGTDQGVALEQMKAQTTRFLKLRNDSGEKMTVFVQYQDRTPAGEPVWVPGEPGSDKALAVELQAGQELFVEANGQKLATSLVRIWAVSDKGQFLEFKGKDLWLVPEQDQNGQHIYLAPEVKTFTFVFPRLDESTGPPPVAATDKGL